MVPTVFSGSFAFVFALEEAKAVDLGRGESHGPTQLGALRLQAQALQAGGFFFLGSQEAKYKFKKAQTGKAVSLLPTQNQPECDLQHSPLQPKGLYLLPWEPFGQIWKGGSGAQTL